MHRLPPWVLVAGVLLVPFSARAQDVTSSPSRSSLAGHRFIPREQVSNPFTSSFVASSSGVSSGSATGPTFDLDGNPVNLEDYKIVSYSQLFTGQWGIADFWAVRLRMLGTAYTGANASGAAGVGVNGVIRGSVGTSFSFKLADNLRLGALVDVAWGPSIGISILDAIRQSISEGSVQTPVTNQYSTTVTPALSLAWAVTRGLGAVVNAAYVNGVVEVNTTSSDLDMAVVQGALDLDLRELGSIPLGLALDYSAGYSVENKRFRRYVLGFGIFYTGRPGLTLGLDLGYRRSPLGTKDVFTTSISGIFSLRYDFD
ncbi:MAG TPA: hypothetical protein VLT82_09485 [Myxococcaceae bacterium]|nr:hypothetical protein [Myxococcaceae bacterium]